MAKGKPAKTKVLSGHTRVGKKFFPPAARLGWTEVHYIERILPEIAWMEYFIEQFGTEHGLEVVERFLRICYSTKSSGSKFFFCSGFESLTRDEWARIRKSCKAKGIYLEVLDALTPFARCYPTNNPFKSLFEQTLEVTKASAADIERSRTVISQLFDRRSSKGVRGHEKAGVAVRFEPVGHFCGERCLPGAIDSHDRYHRQTFRCRPQLGIAV